MSSVLVIGVLLRMGRYWGWRIVVMSSQNMNHRYSYQVLLYW
jgi:isoprenylcysteine carboxyl methyltransferase (ICMT) family protein YpbQ